MTTSPFTARDRDYGFDLANNRNTSSVGGGGNSTYATNNLNQYLHINPPSGPNQVFTYDADRNLTSNGTWDFTYDAANRVTLIEPSAAPGSRDANDVKLEFKYDHVGRRVEKKVTAWDPNAVDWESTPTTHLKYGYDGDELVIEYNGLNSDSVERRYRWALGKLWWMRKLIGARYMMMRDVQDNVTMLVKRTGLAVEGMYEYDALGNVLSVAGAYGEDNPMRWGSGYRDGETGFVANRGGLTDPVTGRTMGNVDDPGGPDVAGGCPPGMVFVPGRGCVLTGGFLIPVPPRTSPIGPRPIGDDNGIPLIPLDPTVDVDDVVIGRPNPHPQPRGQDDFGAGEWYNPSTRECEQVFFPPIERDPIKTAYGNCCGTELDCTPNNPSLHPLPGDCVDAACAAHDEDYIGIPLDPYTKDNAKVDCDLVEALLECEPSTPSGQAAREQLFWAFCRQISRVPGGYDCDACILWN